MEVLTSETIFLQNVFSQAVNLVHVDVRRDLRMNVIAMHLIFKVPIIWMSGYFSLSKAKVFGFIPAGGNGNFNKLWLKIKHELKIQQLEYSFVLTKYHKQLILDTIS